MVVFPMLGKFSNDTSFYKFVCRLYPVCFSFFYDLQALSGHIRKLLYISFHNGRQGLADLLNFPVPPS